MKVSEQVRAFVGNIVTEILIRLPEIQRDPRFYFKKIQEMMDFYKGVDLNGKIVDEPKESKFHYLNHASAAEVGPTDYVFRKIFGY